MHSLALTFSTTTSCDKLVIQDASYYDANTPIMTVILEVKAPGSCCFKVFNLSSSWCSKTLTCFEFDTCCEGACSPLPDGNYEVKYSVDPNLQTMVEYNHFRVCNLWKSYINKVCKLRREKCDYSKSDFKVQLEKLYNIRNMILDAVAMAEECLDVEMAIELYDEAKRLLTNDENCPTCQ